MKKMSREERRELMRRMEARIQQLRNIEARGLAELEAKQRAEESPRRRRLFGRR
jgi:hypothetical protein